MYLKHKYDKQVVNVNLSDLPKFGLALQTFSAYVTGLAQGPNQ